MLKIANERVFQNGGQEIPLPLISLFGASKEAPQGNELEALFACAWNSDERICLNTERTYNAPPKYED
ncbi:MAG: hypothetical protein J2P21_18345 [Chloracidobacterium sp.]|nr:hypothetical protein [Chloracidobacterium sp.]